MTIFRHCVCVCVYFCRPCDQSFAIRNEPKNIAIVIIYKWNQVISNKTQQFHTFPYANCSIFDLEKDTSTTNVLCSNIGIFVFVYGHEPIDGLLLCVAFTYKNQIEKKYIYKTENKNSKYWQTFLRSISWWICGKSEFSPGSFSNTNQINSTKKTHRIYIYMNQLTKHFDNKCIFRSQKPIPFFYIVQFQNNDKELPF